MVNQELLEWTGCIFGLLGSLLLATNGSYSRWGWVAYLVSNIALILYAYAASANGILVQQIGFLITGVVGLHRWFTPLRQPSATEPNRITGDPHC